MVFLNLPAGQCFDVTFPVGMSIENNDFATVGSEVDDRDFLFKEKVILAVSVGVLACRIIAETFEGKRYNFSWNTQRRLECILTPILFIDNAPKICAQLVRGCLRGGKQCYLARRAKQILEVGFPYLEKAKADMNEIKKQKERLEEELFEGAAAPHLIGISLVLFAGNRVERHTVSTFMLELKRVKYLCLLAVESEYSRLRSALRGFTKLSSLECSRMDKIMQGFTGVIPKVDSLLVEAEKIQKKLESEEEVGDLSSFESKHETFIEEMKGLSGIKRENSSKFTRNLSQLLGKLAYEPSYRARDILDTATNMNNDQRKNIESRVRGVEFSAHRLRHLGGVVNVLSGGVEGLIKTGRMQSLVQLHRDCMRESDPLARCKVFKKYMAHNIDGFKGCVLELIRLRLVGEEHAEVRNRLTTGVSDILERFEGEVSDLNRDHLQYNPSPEEYFRQVRIATQDSLSNALDPFLQQNLEFVQLVMQGGQISTEQAYLRNRIEFLLCQFSLLVEGVRIQGAVDRNFMRDLVFEPTRGKEDFDRERGFLEEAEPAGADN